MSQGEQYRVDREGEIPVSPAVVQQQLQRILASHTFLSSSRLSKFLRFSVEATLRGEGEQIKEYLIGTEVFGRSNSYDPRTDPVVRVEAGRLRLKLAEYYRTEGQGDPVLIDLPKGRYVAVFQARSPRVEIDRSRHGIANRGVARRVWAAGLAVVAVMAALSTYYFRARSTATSVPASIAVLPFANLSASPDDQYLGDGLAEELTTALAQLDGVRVVAASSAFQFRGKGEDVRRIGQRLNAGALLEGSVSKSAGRLRITAQLVSTQNGYHLWSKAYDVDAGTVFNAEEDIVRQAATMLRVPAGAGRNFHPAKHETQDAEAHDLYLQGRYYLNKRNLPDMERSIRFFEAATRRDPNFALAYAGLAQAYVILGGNGQEPLAEVTPRAKAALARALELDPDLAEAHATLALLHSEMSGERRGLEPELRRAVELSPGYATAHHWLGLILSRQGRFEEADVELRKAQILDPLSLMITEGVAENFYYWRRYDDAIEQSQRIRKMGSSLGDDVLGRAYVEKAMYEDAIGVFSTLRKGDQASLAMTKLAITYAATGQKAEARSLLRQATTPPHGYVPPYWIAVAYLYLGEKDTTFRWLQRAYEQNDPSLGSMKVEPMLDPIRSEQRYFELLAKADLSD